MLGIPEGASPESRSICYRLQVAYATAHHVTSGGMEAERTLWRIERLQAAIDKLDEGNLQAFGRRMGWKDGSYVGQMLRGSRPITEKLIQRIEEIRGMAGWFDPEIELSEQGALEYRIRVELLRREIPQHTLQTILDLVSACPLHQKTA